jgi:hypothetical protein
LGGAGDDGINRITTLADGTVAATGYRDMPGGAGLDLWLLRLGTDGRVLLDHTLDRSVFNAGSAIVHTGGDHMLLGGLISDAKMREDDAWLLRLDAEGRL